MNKCVFNRPGKLYLAGEYAVVKGGHAILLPTAQTMDLTIDADSNFVFDGQIFSVDGDGKTSLSLPYVKDAIELTHAYLLKKHITIKPYHIETKNHLKIKSLPKLGFGTSAIITILLIESILAFHEVNLDALTLYKLGVLAQIKKYPDSSYGDIALISLAKWTHYSPFKSDFRQTLIEQGLDALNITWPGLILKAIDPFLYPMLFVYTLQAASSLDLVKHVMEYQDTESFHAFIKRSDDYVHDLLNCHDGVSFMSIIERLNQNLLTLDKLTHAGLFTDSMKAIDKVIKACGGVSKFSGAGGGDSMIAVFKDEITFNKAKQALEIEYPILNAFFKEVPNE